LAVPFQERFPQYYKYFSTESFVYHGETMRNHNHLLGAVEGTDGIKTGYTRASGFNLVASVHRDGRRIVAVILGGKSSFERDVRQESSRRKGGRMPPMRWRDQGATYRQNQTRAPNAAHNHAPAAKNGLMIVWPRRSHANADKANKNQHPRCPRGRELR
jgi:D-alanyl-D-alanine carboxypeptidase